MEKGSKNSLSLLLLVVFFIFIPSSYSNSQPGENTYAVALINTPVLNTSDFESVFGGETGMDVKLDSKGLIREMEYIALPNTTFEILEVIPRDNHSIYRVKTEDYPYTSSDLFIDSRFVQPVNIIPPGRVRKIADKEEILKNINSLEGARYMWGGNYAGGIEQLLEFYQPRVQLDENTKDLWCLKGVDCSGLIYQATGGNTPRNTSSLINYGQGLDISGKNSLQISQMLLPLDLIAWSGHVIIVLDGNTVIESTPDLGVHKSDLLTRLKSIQKERIPVNDWDSSKGKRFVIRRWIDN